MNVNLWFAKDVDSNEIISVVNADNEKEYKCPICDSEVIPKAVKSKKIAPHFAHVDKSKCGGEALVHWWMKHKFIEAGESFTIETDKKIPYVCKNFNTEVRYELNSGVYIPDIIVETECGNEIVFEMANTNKKHVKDYIDKWIELDKIIVEVDIKSLVNDSKEFKALYYNGKCFNFNKRDGGYYNTIGRLKESMISKCDYDIEAVKKLDWFWDELIKYKKGELNIKDFSDYYDYFSNEEKQLVFEIVSKKKCENFFREYYNYKAENLINCINNNKLIPPEFINFFKLEKYIHDWDRLSRLNSGGVLIKNTFNYTARDEDSYEYTRNIKQAEIFIYKVLEELNSNSEVISHMKLSKNSDFKKSLEGLQKYINSVNSEAEISFNNNFDRHSVNKLLLRYKDLYMHVNINDTFNDENIEYDCSIAINKLKNFFKIIKKNERNSIVSKNISEKFKNMIRTKEYLPGLTVFTNNSNTYVLSEGNMYKSNVDFTYNSITGRGVTEMNFLDKFYNSLVFITKEESKMKDYLTKELVIEMKCVECHELFDMFCGEIDFYKNRNFSMPKRCKSCRKKRKKLNSL